MAKGLFTDLFTDDPNSGVYDNFVNSPGFKTAKGNFANLFADDPNSGFLDTMARERKMKREAEALAMQQRIDAASGINPNAIKNRTSSYTSGAGITNNGQIRPAGAAGYATPNSIPVGLEQANMLRAQEEGLFDSTIASPPFMQSAAPGTAGPNLGVDFSQMSNVNTANPQFQVPEQTIGDAYAKYGLTGMAKGLFGFGQNNNMGVDAKGNPIPLSQIPGAEGASSYSNQNVQDMQGGLGETLGNLVPDSLKDSLSNFKSGYDNLSKEDAEAMISAFQQATARPEATPFASIRPSAASAGYRIPVENLYNRGLLKI